MNSRLWFFVGASEGQFSISSNVALRGDPLPEASHLYVSQQPPNTLDASFSLKGTVSNERYTHREEKDELIRRQVGLGRSEARSGAFIALKKNDAWWALTQDERYAIFEKRSAHIKVGIIALPAVARRLHHCRDLGEDEPFDFLTWFDFLKNDEPIFDEVLGTLRATEEWEFVEREVELRVERS